MTEQYSLEWFINLIKAMERAADMDEKLKTYLDAQIMKWREKKAEAETGFDKHTATAYIDCLQEIREKMFGSVLPQRQ